jgi:adenosine deaminase
MRAAHGLDDAELAELGRMSVRGSRAPDDVKRALIADIDRWLAAEPDRMDP